MDKIKAIIKHPGKNPEPIEIDNTLETLQKLVEGYIETVSFATNMTIVCNEEGVWNAMPFNCTLFGHQLFGPIVFVGTRKDSFCDIPITFDEFKDMFKSLFSEQALRKEDEGK